MDDLGSAQSSPAISEALANDLTIDITTTGRRSGRPRRIEIWFLRVNGNIYITGTPRPRDWLANLRADPRFTFHLKESMEADLAAVATEVVDLAERRTVVESMAAEWYRGKADIETLITDAPMVRVDFPNSSDQD